MSTPRESEPARILLVDDDSGVQQVVRAALENAECVVVGAGSLEESRRRIAHGPWDAIILDVKLPDGSGMTLAQDLRRAGSTVPILMLTVQSSLPDRVAGLDRGADDYLCKPFEVAELQARVHALLRRTHGAQPHILRSFDVELDLVKRSMARGRLRAELSARESELLAYFLGHPQEVLDRRRILQDIWREESEEGNNVLNVYVNYLRNKLEGGVYPRLIHTVRGVGYVFSENPPEPF